MVYGLHAVFLQQNKVEKKKCYQENRKEEKILLQY